MFHKPKKNNTPRLLCPWLFLSARIRILGGLIVSNERKTWSGYQLVEFDGEKTRQPEKNKNKNKIIYNSST